MKESNKGREVLASPSGKGNLHEFVVFDRSFKLDA
jgi:hypothetical protein